ncbi:MAG: hypothetical protein M3Q08_00970 [Pseudomonadota bacterium]|nr:hypothetical protein [Pseudomonadota bacterium]
MSTKPLAPGQSPTMDQLAADMTHKILSWASEDTQRQLIALRLASPLRPIGRGSAPVDGLDLFDAVRSPKLL